MSVDTRPLVRAVAAAGRPPSSRGRIRAFRDAEGSNLAFTALRLGLAPAFAARLRAGGRPQVLPGPQRLWLLARAEAESARLARLGRGRDPRYDLNRHLAAARLRRWLSGDGESVVAPPLAARLDRPAPPPHT